MNLLFIEQPKINIFVSFFVVFVINFQMAEK